MEGNVVSKTKLSMILEIHTNMSLKRSFSVLTRGTVLGGRELCSYLTSNGLKRNAYQKNYEEVMDEINSGYSKYF